MEQSNKIILILKLSAGEKENQKNYLILQTERKTKVRKVDKDNQNRKRSKLKIQKRKNIIDKPNKQILPYTFIEEIKKKITETRNFFYFSFGGNLFPLFFFFALSNPLLKISKSLKCQFTSNLYAVISNIKTLTWSNHTVQDAC